MTKSILLWIFYRLKFLFVCQKERCSGKSDGQQIIYMKNNDYGKRLFAGTVPIYFDLFKKYISTSDQNYHILKVVSVKTKVVVRN